MRGGRLLETENKTMCHTEILAQKVVVVVEEIEVVVAYERVFETVFD